jgi:hypothetical protein
VSRLVAAFLFLLTFAASAQGPMFPGPGDRTRTATYTGPGDVVASAAAWWGLRAYSAATRGNPAINVCNVADVACADMSTDATTGALVVTTVGGSSCSVVTCTVKTIYDQSGALNCTSAACNLTNATIAQRPVLTLNCIGSLPCLTSSSSAGSMASAANGSIFTPYTVVAGAQRTGNFTAYNTLLSNTAGTEGLWFHNTGNAVFIANGTEFNFAASNSAWHVLQVVGNGASSSTTTDGTTNSITTSSSALINGSVIRAFEDGFGDQLVGTWVEQGAWPVAFSGGNITAMNSNIHTYWGF